MPLTYQRLISFISFLALFFIPILSGCCTEETCAPVVNAWHDPDAMKSRYCVQKDDTVYSIAWAFDMDYRDIVKANHLAPPYRLKTGQTLSMFVPSTDPVVPHEICLPVATASPCESLVLSAPCLSKAVVVHEDIILPQTCYSCRDKITDTGGSLETCLPKPLDKTCITADAVPAKRGCWCWPACGKVVKEFALQPGGNKGIDIAGELDASIKSIAPGKVVYSGSGLRGYGNLIIIKHSDNYLSAYAYNKKLLVKEGDVVRAGTEIAKMGQNDNGQVLLHFEIRRNGKPVNPLLYL